MNTKTINTVKTNKTEQNIKTPRKTAVKYTPLEMEAIRLGKEIRKALENTENDFV